MAPELPLEVWNLIAGNLSAKCWAKACGTCQASFRAQLARIRLDPENSAKLQWLTKRWHTTGIISLQLRGCPESLRSQLYASIVKSLHSADPAGSFSNLAQIGISIDDVQPAAWLTSLLTRAVKLEVLLLDVLNVQPLPPLGRLKHLLLYINRHQKLSESLCTSLAGLPCLQTLCIGVLWRQQHPSLHNSQNQDVAAPALDLRSCTQMHAVSFQALVPASLKLPDGCTAHFECDLRSCETARDSWSHATSAIIHGWWIQDLLPGFFGRTCQQLTSLTLYTMPDMWKLNIASAFPNLKYLSVSSGQDVSVTLPASLNSSTLCIEGTLRLEPQDTITLADNLSYLELEWMQDSHYVEELLAAMIAVGKPCKRKRVDSFGIDWQDNTDYDNMISHHTAVLGEYLGNRCCCQACVDCMLSTEAMEGCLVPINSPFPKKVAPVAKTEDYTYFHEYYSL